MRTHAGKPFGPNRFIAHSGKRINREARYLAKVDAADDTVDFRTHGIETTIDPLTDSGSQRAVLAQMLRAIRRRRVTRQVRAIRAHQCGVTARIAPDQRVKVLEIARP